MRHRVRSGLHSSSLNIDSIDEWSERSMHALRSQGVVGRAPREGVGTEAALTLY